MYCWIANNEFGFILPSDDPATGCVFYRLVPKSAAGVVLNELLENV